VAHGNVGDNVAKQGQAAKARRATTRKNTIEEDAIEELGF